MCPRGRFRGEGRPRGLHLCLLYRNNTKINRPIIFKLASNYDKQLVMNSLKHLKGALHLK